MPKEPYKWDNSDQRLIMVFSRDEMGERIKKRRTFLGISNDQLAEMTGIPLGTITSYLSGKNYPTYEALHRLSVVLQVPIGWFFVGSEEVEFLINYTEILESINQFQARTIKELKTVLFDGVKALRNKS